MANPIVRHSVDAAAATGPGSPVDTLGHYHAGLFVAVADPANLTSLTVQLEVSPDGERWAPVTTVNGNALSISETALQTDPTSGEDTAAMSTPAVYGREVRANVTAYEGSATVDAWVMTGGNSGRGSRPTERQGPASDL